MSEKSDRQDRVAKILIDAWRANRLVPRLFSSARAVREGVPDASPFGFTVAIPIEYLQGRADNIWTTLGVDFAVGETREFIDLLARTSSVRNPGASLIDAVYDTARDAEAYGDGRSVIFAPARWRVLSALGLEGRPGSPEAPGSVGSRWYRGSFQDIPVFAVPLTPPRALWVVNLSALGTWETRGGVDDIEVRFGLLREPVATINDQRVPATSVTVEQYFRVHVEDPKAAIGLSLPEQAEVPDD